MPHPLRPPSGEGVEESTIRKDTLCQYSPWIKIVEMPWGTVLTVNDRPMTRSLASLPLCVQSAFDPTTAEL